MPSRHLSHRAVAGIYPERPEARLTAADRFAAAVGGALAPWFRPRPQRFAWVRAATAAQAQTVGSLDDRGLRTVAGQAAAQLRREGFAAPHVGLVFALVQAAAQRTVGLRVRDVQLVGGAVLLHGMVAEMETGEGKTLVATLPAAALALAGVPVHVITVNDYLAQRDAEWMGPVYRALGLTVGTIVHGKDPAARRAAYRCDVTYCTNKEAAFDYLRDRLVLWDRPSPIRLQLERLTGVDSRVDRLTMRGLPFAIVDEADSVLVDEARTPLIISSTEEDAFPPVVYTHALLAARSLASGRDFRIGADRTVELTARGRELADQAGWSALGVPLSPGQREELVRQGLVALYLFERDRHYLVTDGKVQIVDEFTGRLMADRSWERGLHQLIEAKEDCPLTPRKDTRARISYQRFFRRYQGLAGMTGTAREVAAELWSVYHLPVVSVPTARPLRRRILPDQVHASGAAKWQAVVQAVTAAHGQGRPVLVGTRSVEASEHLSRLLDAARLEHHVLNARQDANEAQIVAEAGARGRITVATNMAGRGTDIRLGEGVPELGGLCVVATERHEARRIDRQLFGRCGRQGDPGTAQALVSLDDELVETYTWRPLRWTVRMLLRFPGGAVGRLCARLLFGRAQRAAERLHGRMRRELLTLDDQISDSLAFSGRPE